MKKILLFLWLLCPMITFANLPPVDHQEIQEQIAKWQEDFHSSGISLTLFDAENNEFFNDTNGIIDRDSHILFNFSSVVKQFVAVTILQMQQASKLQIDQTVAEILQQYDAADIDDFNPAWKQVTLRQLLNMTSGICSYWDDKQYQQSLVSGKTTQVDLLQIASHCDNTFSPGARWSYSDTNYLLLGKLIELISGDSFAEQMQHRFKDTLALESTFFTQFADASRDRLAVGYDTAGKPIHIQAPLGDSARFILSTTQNMAYWIAQVFDGRLLNEQSLQALKSPVSKQTGQPLENDDAAGYSFAFDRMKVNGCGSIWYYPGNSPGFTTIVVWIPKTKVSMAIALNTNADFDTFFNQVKEFIRLNLCEIDK